MQRLAALPMLLLLAACSTGHAHASSAAGALSPITRVVDLLKSLTTKIEQEGKAEQDLYETFVCWAKSVVDTKRATNAAAESRMDTLKTYIADLDAGRIELTSERADLEKDIEQLNADIELATELRNKEQKEFEDAKDEMQKAIAALSSAIGVLRTATEDHKDGVFLRLKGELSQGTSSGAAERAALSYAVDLGVKFLSKGDALFLQRVLTGDVPTPDWKKLNRAATFKKSYKARSFKIQDVLANLLETFSSNLAEAEAKEKEAKSSFGKLMSSKGSEKGSAQQALQNMDKESGAKGLSRSEASDELSALTDQVKNDKGYIDQVTQSLSAKKGEWKTRSELRTGELGAISQAIAILHSGDARDLFKKSLKSQSYSLLQEDSRASTRRRGGAAEALRAAASAVHDRRLAALAKRLEVGGHFDEVIAAIDTMLGFLKDEEADDLKQKETCESDRASDTRDAALASREIDDMSDLVTSLEADVADLTQRIEDKTRQVASITKELAEEKRIRDDEHAEYLVAKKEDADARQLVIDATQVLKGFYEQNGLMLAQRQNHGQPRVVAGAAPPPPPTTWEKPYAGRTEESTGIIAVMEMIAEDIQKDQDHAQKNEDDSKALYDKTKESLGKEKGDLEGLIQTETETRGQKEGTIKDTKVQRRTKKGTLDVVLKKIRDAEPGCDFFTVNFPLRTTNRQIEIDGLHKAKAILSGASFSSEDPSRELKPGDALLQRVRRHPL